MGELEDRINDVLKDPAQMEQIMGMARSLMGGESAGAGLSGLLQGLADPGEGGGAAPDPGLMDRIGRLLREENGRNDSRALLEAMRPWLSEKRRGKMDRALRLARVARIAGIALGEAGGKGDV